MPGHFRDLCNAGLQQHIEAWKRQGGSLGYADQANEQKAVRDAVPELAGYSCSAERQVLRRLDKAFAAFLRVGDGLVFKGGRLPLVGVPGLVKVRWHRELPAKPLHVAPSWPGRFTTPRGRSCRTC